MTVSEASKHRPVIHTAASESFSLSITNSQFFWWNHSNHFKVKGRSSSCDCVNVSESHSSRNIFLSGAACLWAVGNSNRPNRPNRPAPSGSETWIKTKLPPQCPLPRWTDSASVRKYQTGLRAPESGCSSSREPPRGPGGAGGENREGSVSVPGVKTETYRERWTPRRSADSWPPQYGDTEPAWSLRMLRQLPLRYINLNSIIRLCLHRCVLSINLHL